MADPRRKILGKFVSATLLLVVAHSAIAATSKNEARVTRIIRDVKLLPSEAASKPASLNDEVREDTAVRTGEDSRSELTFTDLRITRLGANTIFTFNKAGHNFQLNSGSILLYVPKDAGDAQMATSAVSVAVTGTTVTFESKRDDRTLLTVLEGGARASLIKYPQESVYVRGGQMIDVPPGAIKMPQPVNIDLREAMKSPLITDFSPLPSLPLIGTAGPPPPDAPTPCTQVTGEARCLSGGGYSYPFNATNSTGSDMSQVLLTPQAGSTFTLSPQLFSLSSPLPNGQSTTASVNIGNGKPGDKVCFFVTLIPKEGSCCTAEVCLTLPDCGGGGNATSSTPRLRPGKRRP